MSRSEQMSSGNIPKLLLKYSLPAIIGMLVNALYNVVDSIFVGQGVGELALAGTTVSFPIIIILMAFVMLVGMGATALISIRLGENKEEEAEKIIGNSLVLFFIVGVSLTILGLIFIEPMLKFFGATPSIIPYSLDYMRVILLGSLFMAIGIGMNNFIRAEGNPKIAMYTMLIGAAVNIILDYIFIFKFFWGIKGAAFATVISQGISSTWVLYHFLSSNSSLKIRIKNFKLDSALVRNIMAVGFPAFALQLTSSVQHLILNRSLSHYGGDMALAAIGIVMSVASMLIMPAIGISQGAQPIIGFNHGAKNFHRVKDTLKLAIIAASSIVTFGFVGIRLGATQLVKLFNDNPELIELGTHAMKTYFMFLPLIGMQIIGANYFQAIGKPRRATVLSLSRQVLIFIPLVLILPRFFGLDGIWRAAPAADLGAFLITGTCLFFELRKLNKKPADKLIQTINS